MTGPLTALPELADLAREINHHHVEATRAAGAAVNHACKAGECLIEAKAMLPHGQWLSWLEANCQVSERSAQAYMRVARELPKLEGSKAQRVADLPLRQFLDSIAEPKPELRSATLREAVINEHRRLCHFVDNPLAAPLPRDTPEHFRELLDSCKGVQELRWCHAGLLGIAQGWGHLALIAEEAVEESLVSEAAP
jgi:hypothetical protein